MYHRNNICGVFQSTLPMRGETQSRICCSLHFWYFNPLSPCGERLPSLPAPLPIMQFQSTLPMRGETGRQMIFAVTVRISIHSPHAGRDLRYRGGALMAHISIHSPHAGRDGKTMSLTSPKWYFNPLSPCGERRICRGTDRTGRDFNPLSPCGERHHASKSACRPVLFQSTLPMRGETGSIVTALTGKSFQSTLPMRGETCRNVSACHCALISIHSPHAGRDEDLYKQFGRWYRFQSTLPMRGETGNVSDVP